MISWFSNELFFNTQIVTSKLRFTSKKITLEFLKHYIQNSNAEFHADWKLKFMNNHETHLTSEFDGLTNNNHICSYSLISHFTHIMQFFDIDIFESYKYWHIKIIREIIEMSFIEYSINQFFRNLNKIRKNACKVTNILHAFKNFDMWLINVKRCVNLFKKFSFDSSQIIESKLSLFCQIKSLTAMKTFLNQ
jgi:hypothetical protein